jgi:hypothetical protein
MNARTWPLGASFPRKSLESQNLLGARCAAFCFDNRLSVVHAHDTCNAIRNTHTCLGQLLTGGLCMHAGHQRGGGCTNGGKGRGLQSNGEHSMCARGASGGLAGEREAIEGEFPVCVRGRFGPQGRASPAALVAAGAAFACLLLCFCSASLFQDVPLQRLKGLALAVTDVSFFFVCHQVRDSSFPQLRLCETSFLGPTSPRLFRITPLPRCT